MPGMRDRERQELLELGGGEDVPTASRGTPRATSRLGVRILSDPHGSSA